VAVAMVAVVAGCSTVTINKQGDRKISSTPTYQDSKPFFLWGLVGDHTVDVSQVCTNGEATQMQTQHTFLDGLLGFVTLGIYAPRTAKVWCS
jgi:hypothetical protein